MSDKMKFGDLFEKIAKDTGSSPEVIRELKKQMGIELRESLEKDGSTHLNGLGTFYLKWSDEREGINPQTGEKIKIEGHNHISFRPDASVRRLINKENEHLKAFILDDSGNKEPEAPVVTEEQKTKVPGWLWILLAILALGLLLSLLSPPKEVVVSEEVIVVEELVVTNDVVIVEEVIVVEEVLVVEEVFVTNDAPAAVAVPVAAEDPVSSDASEIVEEIKRMPTADVNMSSDDSGTDIDTDVLEAEAGKAEGVAEDAVAEAVEAEKKAEKSGSAHAEKKAEEAVAEAEEAIADEMIAEDRLRAAEAEKAK